MKVQIRGAEQLGDLSKRLKAAGEEGKGLRREMYRGIQRATKPLKVNAQDAARRTLPQRGGLAQIVASQKISTRTRSTGSNVGVTIRGTGTAMSTDRGVVRHPVFGGEAWVSQRVQGGWFSDTMRRGAPLVRIQIGQAMKSVAKSVARG